MFPRHIHHTSIPNNAMKWSRMSEKWAKKSTCFASAKMLDSTLKTYTKTTVHSAMTLHVVKYWTFVLWRQHIGMIITTSEKGKVQLKAKTCLQRVNPLILEMRLTGS